MAEGACHRAAEGVQTRHGKGKHTGDVPPVVLDLVPVGRGADETVIEFL